MRKCLLKPGEDNFRKRYISTWYKWQRRRLGRNLAANLFLNDVVSVLTSKTFQAVLAVLATYYAFQSAVISSQAIRISQCQELRQAAESPVKLLSGFLLDPHVESFGWDFHNGVAAEFGSGSVLRRAIGRPFRADTQVCQADGSTWSYINPQFEDGASVAKSFPVEGDSVSADATVGLARQSLVVKHTSTTQSAGTESFFGFDDIDCFIDRARNLAIWLEAGSTNGFNRPADLVRGGERISRNHSTGQLHPYSCREGVSEENCKRFQMETNALVAGAVAIRRGLESKIGDCGKD